MRMITHVAWIRWGKDSELGWDGLVQVLDGDGSGRLSGKELCEALKKLVSPLLPL